MKIISLLLVDFDVGGGGGWCNKDAATRGYRNNQS